MGLFDKFFNRAPLVDEKGRLQSGTSIFGGNSNAITPQTAMQMTTVFACNRVIAETLSSISLDVFRNISNGKEKAIDFSLYNLLKHQPHSSLTSVTWREMMVRDLNTRGNHYSQIIRNGIGEITSIYPLYVDKMEVIRIANGEKRFVYDKKNILSSKEVLHIPGLPSEDGLTGLSPIEYNKRAIQLGDTTQEFGINFFDKGANASGAFSTDGSLSEEAYDRLKLDLSSNYAGMQNSGKPMLLEGGLKFERISITNNDAQFLETRKYQKEEIASIFRVPMHMINSLENATFSNIEHLSLEFVKFTMLPWIRRIEEAFHSSLLTASEQTEYSIKFNVDTLLRGDFQTRTEGYRTLWNIGAINQNEIRELENMNTIGAEGDKYYIPLNTTDTKTGATE